MKTLKISVLALAMVCLNMNYSFAQNMYRVHVDYVKPSKLMEYENVAKDFLEASKKYNLQASWIATTTSDNRYMYVNPIENFAELDKNPFDDMSSQMGSSFQDLFKRFNTCYDEHGDYILVLDDELSYMPTGMTQTPEGENYRNFIFLYYTPENEAKIYDAVKSIKDLFTKKESKLYYRIYRSGFGVSQSYYMVAIASKDEIDSANKFKANDGLLGEDGKEPFQKLMGTLSKYEEITGEMRPDLYYSPN